MQSPRSIVAKNWLLARLYEQDIVIADCRFQLGQSASGRMAYQEDHIPGAVYFDLEQDLSAPIQTHGGRHPLPNVEDLEACFKKAGIGPETRVIAYDDQGGAMASRLWWLLRWLGHDQVYVLDEGYSTWKNAGYPVSSDTPIVVPSSFVAKVRPERVATVDEVRIASSASAEDQATDRHSLHEGEFDVSLLKASDRLSTESSVVEGLEAAFGLEEGADQSELTSLKAPILIDSREPRRYAGFEEPIDHKSGHIPGAVNHFWKNSIGEQGQWKSIQELEDQFISISKDREVIVYCGSGVTACPNVLALEQAGYQNVKLYAGSWSDWISYEGNPVVTEEDNKL
ncbi:thiosulfate/3-mercaptopyruvate sulfurtransferase [Paenibacillus shirakamiensis]|uniref:Thiosulfate/3-mercaptopyruvate sulfurtransferase n=1 Tax=Paenibacillus shirakamiensis TaxID=1265935 RepID=A0ABS4JFV8_9BACL|nr:sulfurtransferase [Paenibacillus shirakamiensis]MBP2000588.1 thiosulfate/3-mercaptopyruvate sulfurtransferase [Paenibacillus shirakamiensis]